MILEPDTRRCVSKETEPRRGGHEVVCQQGCWAPNGGGLEGSTSIDEGNECQRGCWAPKGVDCKIPHWLGRRTKHPLQGCGNLSLAYAF